MADPYARKLGSLKKSQAPIGANQKTHTRSWGSKATKGAEMFGSDPRVLSALKKATSGTGGKKPPVTTKTPTKLTANPSGNTAKTVPPETPGPVKPIVPDINAFLAGDVDYQNQLRQFDKTKADFGADAATRKTRTEADYGEGKRDMEGQRLQDLLAIKDDYAARGLLNSGVYTGRMGEYEQDYGRQLAEFERQYAQALQDLANQGTQFDREQQLASEAARQDAIRRRAQQYGL